MSTFMQGTAKKMRKATLYDIDEAINQWFNECSLV